MCGSFDCSVCERSGKGERDDEGNKTSAGDGTRVKVGWVDTSRTDYDCALDAVAVGR